MTDREKIIKRLEECLSASCRGFRTCPYSDNEWDAVETALALLREQKPRILTLEEVLSTPYGSTVWLESYFDGKTSIEPLMQSYNVYQQPILSNGMSEFILDSYLFERVFDDFDRSYKDKRCRFWNDMPTNEQMEAASWDGRL